MNAGFQADGTRTQTRFVSAVTKLCGVEMANFTVLQWGVNMLSNVYMMHKECEIVRFNNAKWTDMSVYNIMKPSELFRYCWENVWGDDLNLLFRLGEVDEEEEGDDE